MVFEEPSEDSLPELLQRCQCGEVPACQKLLSYRKYHCTVERLARKCTIGTAVCWEDAAQEAHRKVFQSASNRKFREGGVKEFYSWAAAVAQNAILDIIRADKRRKGDWIWKSLDEPLPGKDITLAETIEDEFNLFDAVERAELVIQVRSAVESIDRQYQTKSYLKLWIGLVQDKNQSELAAELGVGPAEISKRRKELILRISEHLGLLQAEQVKRELQAIRHGKGKQRRRSDTQW